MSGRGLAVLLSLILLCAGAGSAPADLLERLDTQREVDLGRAVARQVELMLPVSHDEAVQARVERVGRALVAQLENRVYPYQFKVLALREYNAFAVPGGFIYIYEGVVDRCPDDDSLAFVMAHELTHVAHRHWVRRSKDMRGINLLGAAVTKALGGDVNALASLTSSLIYLRYARADEYEADACGMEYAWKAGFDPAGALTAMKEIVKLEQGDSVPRYLRNHPPGEDRLKRLEQEYEKLKNRPRPETGAAEIPLPKSPGLDLPGVSPAENPWFPLAVGARWRYAVKREGAEGAEGAEYALKVAAETPSAKGSAWRGEVTFGDTSVPCRMLTTHNQVWWREDGAGKGEWRVEYVTGPGAEGAAAGKFQVIGREEVTVPCGRFAGALHVRRTGDGEAACLDLWFAKGVGLVKRLDSGTGVTEVLVDYHVPRAEEPAPGEEKKTGPAERPENEGNPSGR